MVPHRAVSFHAGSYSIQKPVQPLGNLLFLVRSRPVEEPPTRFADLLKQLMVGAEESCHFLFAELFELAGI